MSDFHYSGGRIRPSWNEAQLMRKGKLTDKRIEYYRKRGYYSAEYRQARKKKQELKSFRKNMERQGNFIVDDGRMIYSPR